MSEAKRKDVKAKDLDVSGTIRVGNREWTIPEENPGLTIGDVEELVRRVDSEWTTAVAGIREDMVGLHESILAGEEESQKLADGLKHLDLREASFRPTYFQQTFGEAKVGPGDRLVLDWSRLSGNGAGVVDRELHVVTPGLYEVRAEVAVSTTALAFGLLIAERLDNRKVEDAHTAGMVPLSQNKGLPERYGMTTLVYLNDSYHLRFVLQNNHGEASFVVHGDADLSFLSVRLVEPVEE